jgi:hypothetical protein
MEENKKTSGFYKPKTKFIEFIGAKGNINFISDNAIISAKELSGIYFENIDLKLTIYSDGTVDLDEIDTDKTSEVERQRLLEIIEDKTIGNFRGRTVVNELDFTSVEKVKGKNIPLYLAVEYVTPIEKLTSIFDDRLLAPNQISDDAMDNLNDLLNSWFEDEDFAKEIEEMVNEEDSQVVNDTQEFIDQTFQNNIQESFSKMKEEKLKELQSNKKKKEEEIKKLEFQLSTIEKNVQELKSDCKLLDDRIVDMDPVAQKLDYYFTVSERQNEEIKLDKETEELIRKTVSKVKSINADNFMNLFKDGEFHIHIGKEKDGNIVKLEEHELLDINIVENLPDIDFILSDTTMIYSGELSWGEIVNKFVKKGFQQDPTFDEFCFPKETLENSMDKKSSKF